jgi:hypothetical protein
MTPPSPNLPWRITKIFQVTDGIQSREKVWTVVKYGITNVFINISVIPYFSSNPNTIRYLDYPSIVLSLNGNRRRAPHQYE